MVLQNGTRSLRKPFFSGGLRQFGTLGFTHESNLKTPSFGMSERVAITGKSGHCLYPPSCLLNNRDFSGKEGEKRFLMPKWPEMLTFVFDKTLLQQIYMSRFIIVTFAAFLLLAGCSNDKQANNMAITVNLRYTGVDGNALKFAEEMISSGTVDAIRAEEGNLRYEYYQSLDDPETILLIDSWASQEAIDAHHATPMMATIAALREKYDLHMTVERYTSADMPETDSQFIRQ